MVRFLLEAGADQEHKTDEMHTALMEACMVSIWPKPQFKPDTSGSRPIGSISILKKLQNMLLFNILESCDLLE